jgi:hypothetical protein
MRVPRIVAKVGRDADELDEVKVDAFADEFRKAFTADVSEEERAQLLHDIHVRIAADQEVYQAVAKAIGSRYKNALRVYLEWLQQQRKPLSVVDEVTQHETDFFRSQGCKTSDQPDHPLSRITVKRWRKNVES